MKLFTPLSVVHTLGNYRKRGYGICITGMAMPNVYFRVFVEREVYCDAGTNTLGGTDLAKVIQMHCCVMVNVS